MRETNPSLFPTNHPENSEVWTRWPCASTCSGLGGDGKPWYLGTEVYGDRAILPRGVISRKLTVPNAERIFFIRHARLPRRLHRRDIFQITKLDRWFLTQMQEIVDFEEELAGARN